MRSAKDFREALEDTLFRYNNEIDARAKKFLNNTLDMHYDRMGNYMRDYFQISVPQEIDIEIVVRKLKDLGFRIETDNRNILLRF